MIGLELAAGQVNEISGSPSYGKNESARGMTIRRID